MTNRTMRSFFLAQKIAILITGIIVVMLGTSIALTYRALLRSAEFEASERLVGSAAPDCPSGSSVELDLAVGSGGVGVAGVVDLGVVGCADHGAVLH